MSESRKLLLSLDCSNRWTCLGLVEEGLPLGEVALDLKRRQAGQLAPVAEAFLGALGWRFQDLSYLAVTVGPGYFTGIRVAMAYSMGLALGLGIPVVPLSSLEVLVQSYPQSPRRPLMALMAASKDSAFSAGWDQWGQQWLPERERSWEEIQEARREMGSQGLLIAARDPRLFAHRAEELPLLWLSSPGGMAAALLAWQRRDNAMDPSRLRAEYLKEPGIGGL